MDDLRPRAVATNDGECDDMNTFLHTLLYANEIDIEGLVYSSSVHHYAGDEGRGIAPKRWEDPRWMYRYLDAYAAAYESLRAHDARYPSPDYLRGVTCVGNIRFPGDMEFDTPGSDLIHDAVLRDDPRPVYLLAGGGTNTIARALRRIEDEYRETDEWEGVYRHVCDHAVVVSILLQDDTCRDYISWAWPGVRVLVADSINCVGFTYDATNSPAEALDVFGASWMERNILSRGELGGMYHTWLDGHRYEGDTEPNQFGTNEAVARDGNVWLRGGHGRHQMLSEGDSPAFLHLVDRGLRQLEDPGFGGWGGRFVPLREAAADWGGTASGGAGAPTAAVPGAQTHDGPAAPAPAPPAGQAPDGTTAPAPMPPAVFGWMSSFLERGNPEADVWVYAHDGNDLGLNPKEYQLSRWICDWMNDFSVRLGWAMGADACPETPVARMRGPLDRTVEAGSTVALELETDDGQGTSVEWLVYPDAGDLTGEALLDASGRRAEVTIPQAARPGESVHVLACVRARAPRSDVYAVSYQRTILTVA